MDKDRPNSLSDKAGTEWNEYNFRLKAADRIDLTFVEPTGCVSTGFDNDGNAVVVLIPRIGLGHREVSEEVMNEIFSLFLKTAIDIAIQPFSIVYDHFNVHWAGKPLVYEYYKLLPKELKANVKSIYIIHPQARLKLFIEYTKFRSKTFAEKVQLIDNISDFQNLIPPSKLVLPFLFLKIEDESKGLLKGSGVSIPLHIDFVTDFGTTSLLSNCINYIRTNGGLQRVGIFRVAGNESLLNVVKTRLQPLPSSDEAYMRACMQCVLIGRSESKHAGVGCCATQFGVVDLPVVVVDDVDLVAQIVKSSLRDLAEPLFSFSAYERLKALAKSSRGLDLTSTDDLRHWSNEAHSILGDMEYVNRSTLAHLLDFLREVAAEAATNKMDAQNLATVFAPTLMRPRDDGDAGPAQMLAGIGISQTILLNLLTLPASLRVHGITTLLEEATASEMYSSGITNSSSPGSSSSSGKRRGGEERGGVEGGRQAREGDRGVAKEGVAGEKGSESKRNSRSMDGVLQSLCCASGIDPDSPKSPTDADVRDCDP